MIKRWIDKFHLPNWVLLVLIAVFILRIPSFFEPFSYGDELIYLSLGDAVRKGLTLYKDIHDNKPPLLYLTAAVAGNVFWFKSILAFWSLVTVVLFWKFAKALFGKKQKLIKVSVWVFAILSTLPFLEGNIANAENFMIGFSILAFYILLTKKKSIVNIFVAGLLFSVAALFKIPAAFDVPVIILYWLITSKKLTKDFFPIVGRSIIISIGFLLPIAATMAWYWGKGALPEYLVAAFGQNVGYLSSFRPDDIKEPFLVRNGPLLARASIAGVGILAVFAYRKRLSKPFVLATIWLLLALFAITLSERPYPHYILQGVPAISILIGILVAATTLEQSLAILPLFLAVLAPVYYKFWYYSTAAYYQRFIDFAVGKTDQQLYFDNFDKNVNRNYEIANFLTKLTSPNDKVFVWGNSSAIYALSRRQPPIKYVADYHIRDFSSKEEVMAALEKTLPAYIVVLPDSEQFNRLQNFLDNEYMLVTYIEGAEIWHEKTF